MANKSLFKSAGRGRSVPKTNTVNDAGGKAYSLSPEAALARYAFTGCLSNTFYVKAEDHLDRVLETAGKCSSEFLAKLAVLARQDGFMKDMPATLLAILSTREDGKELFRQIFPQVIDNGRMIRTFTQIIRSDRVGRKSLGTAPKDMIGTILNDHDPEWVFRQLAVGQDPSGADVIKLAHPKPKTPAHEATYGYLIGNEAAKSHEALPELIRHFEAWKADKSNPIPRVDFRLLTAQTLTDSQWREVFMKGNWHFLRMNLNTAQRHNVFEDASVVEFVAEKLRDEEIIKKVRVMPHQLLAAYKHASPNLPRKIINALHDALEIATQNVPAIEGKTLIIVDVSGSMHGPITGGWSYSPGSSKVRCVDAAALLACTILRKNDEAVVLPVDTEAHTRFKPEPRNAVLSEAQNLANFGGGGTNLSLGLKVALQSKTKPDNVITISDQESWADFNHWGGTASMYLWEQLKAQVPEAKMVCLDIVPGRTHQTLEGRNDILHVSGWNDNVFQVIDRFLRNETESWLDMIYNSQL